MTYIKRRLALVITLSLCAVGPAGSLTAGQTEPGTPPPGAIASIHQTAASLAIEPRVPFDFGLLVVTGPEGPVAREPIAPGEAVLFAPGDWAPLTDGTYRWELRLVTEPAEELVRAADQARDRNDVATWRSIQPKLEPRLERLSGSFLLTDGALLENGPSGLPGPLTVEGGVIGLFTSTPDDDVELEISDGLPEIRLDSTTGLWDIRVSTNDFQIIDSDILFPPTVLEIDKEGVNYTLKFDGDAEFTGTVSDGSSRELKRDLQEVPSASVLETLSGLRLYEWSYVKDPEGVRHLGPIAQDFHAAFGLGRDAEHLSPIDTGGVALAAIQALAERLEEKDREILELRRRLEALEAGR